MLRYHQLRNSVNPHFLFNTFTSLDGLILTNPPLASEFVQYLSKVYRYVLEQKEKVSVRIEGELEFMENYLSLLEIRYGQGLAVVVDVTEEARQKNIVPVTLQTLVDNAIKLNSNDYLLKPIAKQDLAAAFQKFHLLQSKYGNKQYVSELKTLFNNFEQPKKYKDRFAVYSGRAVTLAPAAETACFIKEEIIYLLHRNGTRYITDFRSLDEVEELIDPGIFFRVNRQHLAHLNAMESYQSDDWGKLHIRLKEFLKDLLTVSKEKAAEFKRWFG